ncbi:MAG: hypothetical protein WDO16_21810 [Bacteroidota bacterium]
MRKVLLFLLIGVSFSLGAQTGAQRKCGNEFAAYGLKGVSFSDALDVAGKTHNDYQESLLTQLSAEKISLKDTSSLKTVIQNKTISFLGQKGILVNRQSFSISFVAANNSFSIQGKSYSAEATRILTELQSLIKSYDMINSETLINSLIKLKQAALNLADEKEVFAIGIPVVVAINSYNYWRSNADKWYSIFAGQTDPESQSKRKPCHVGLGQLGAADVGGAIGGGYGGTVLGPGGAFAGAVLGSATSSLGNLAGQVMGCLFSWW